MTSTNHLDVLLSKVEDPALRAQLEREVDRLRDDRQFGLVFERHLPETVRLYTRPVRRGSTVQVIEEQDGPTWWVKSKSTDKVTLERTEDGETFAEVRSPDELVVVAEFGQAIYPGFESVGSVERGGHKPFHTVINGENYHALEALLYACEGQVDCIYIDPPYNTGARDWKYNNDYVESEDTYRHSKWLSFMEKRLKVAKRLLNPADSVLIVTIDEKEYLRLGLLLEQVFPEARMQMVTTIIKPEGTNRRNEFSRTNEFIFYVGVGDSYLKPNADNMFDEVVEASGSIEWRNLRRRGASALRHMRRNQFFPFFVEADSGKIHSIGEALTPGQLASEVEAPNGTFEVFPLAPDGTETMWSKTPNAARELLAKGYVRWNGSTIQYLPTGTVSAIERGDVVLEGVSEDGAVSGAWREVRSLMPKTVWARESHNAQTSGTLLLKRLIPDRLFPFPKSLYAVEDAIRFFVGDKPEALVIDFFSGSGTTAHAVMRLNRQDGGRRRSIAVTNNEVSDTEAKALAKSGHRPGDPEWEALGIFEHITRPRIEAAVTGITHTGDPVKGDYKFTDEFPMADGFEENVEFLKLTYEDPSAVSLGRAFEAIAPLLWLKAGATGPRIDKIPTKAWALPKGATYGVLFSPGQWRDFLDAVAKRDDVRHVFVVTDSESVFQQVVAEVPTGVEATMLYEDYLSTFTVNRAGEG